MSGVERHEAQDLAPFHEVHVAGMLRTKIVRNGAHAVTLLGDDNLLEHVQTEVSGGVLVIRAERRLRPGAGLKVRVAARELDARDFACDKVEMSVSGAGKASVCATSSLAARISGAGKIECYGRPGRVTEDISGAGKVELK